MESDINMCKGVFWKQIIGRHLNSWKLNWYTEVKSIDDTLSPNFSSYLKYTANYTQLYLEYTILFEMRNNQNRP